MTLRYTYECSTLRNMVFTQTWCSIMVWQFDTVLVCTNRKYPFFLFLVPPKRPVIVDESGIEASTTIGPYAEGVSVEVSCEVSGGKLKLAWCNRYLIIITYMKVKKNDNFEKLFNKSYIIWYVKRSKVTYNWIADFLHSSEWKWLRIQALIACLCISCCYVFMVMVILFQIKTNWPWLAHPGMLFTLPLNI